MKTDSAFTVIELIIAVTLVALIVLSAVFRPVIPLRLSSTAAPTLTTIREGFEFDETAHLEFVLSTANAALLEFDGENNAPKASTKTSQVPRPIIVGYKLSTEGTPALTLAVLFPEAARYPTFGVRFSETVPASPRESLNESYGRSAPAIVSIAGWVPAGGVVYCTITPPWPTQANVREVKAVELFGRDFRQLGVVPIIKPNAAYVLRGDFPNQPAWLPINRYLGFFTDSWRESVGGLPMLPAFEVPAVRSTREQVQEFVVAKNKGQVPAQLP